jgi:hypothetical protein
MKAFYLLFFFLISFEMSAQNRGKAVPLSAIPLKESLPIIPEKSAAGIALPLYIDYITTNGDDVSYLWPFNSNYTATDTAINFAGVAFDRIIGYQTYSPPYVILDYAALGLPNAYPANQVLFIDTAFVFYSHENNSGNMDYIQLDMVELLPNNSIGLGNTVLWSQIDSANTGLSPTQNWSDPGAYLLKFYHINTTTLANQKVGLVFKYFDASKLDTLGLLAGCVLNGNVALQSVMDNSYMRYPPTFPLGKNANAVVSNPPFGIGYFLAQNWGLSIKAGVFNAIVAVADQSQQEQGLMVATLADPSGNFVFRYRLPNKVGTLQILDLSGKVLEEHLVQPTNDWTTYSINASHLAKGMYLTRLLQNNKEIGISKLIK